MPEEMGDANEMARRFYGYGRWAAPYWFIGPEQGQARNENNDLGPRLKAWRDLGAPELCDCKQYCDAFNLHRWHEKGDLQPTWVRLILLLMTFLNKPADRESLRRYQRSQWGSTNDPRGETCVIELSGWPANNQTTPRDRETFRQQRIEVIRERMSENHLLQLVVMYGKSEMKSWEKIAGRSFRPDNILKSGGTTFAAAAHPVSFEGVSYAYWKELGQRLRKRHLGPEGRI